MIITTASKNRETEVLKFLTEFKKEELYLFIEPQEFEKYEKLYPQVTVVNIKENDKGFGYLLNFINNFVINDLNEKHYFFLDDDIKGFEKRIEEKKLRKIKENTEIKTMFEEIEKHIKETDYSQIGLSFNVHNRFCDDEIEENKGMWCALINNAEDIEKVGGYDKELKIFSDWEISARLISKGFKNAITYRYAFNHQMKSKKGGAENIYANLQLIEDSCKYVKNKYGDVCIIKHNKSHNIPEIRFSWKLLQSQSNKFLYKNLLAFIK